MTMEVKMMTNANVQLQLQHLELVRDMELQNTGNVQRKVEMFYLIKITRDYAVKKN